MPVVFLRFAFWPHSNDRSLAAGYPHCAHAAQKTPRSAVRRNGAKGKARTFVLPVEGAVPAPPAEGVGLGVLLTADVKFGLDSVQGRDDGVGVPEGRGSFCLRGSSAKCPHGGTRKVEKRHPGRIERIQPFLRFVSSGMATVNAEGRWGGYGGHWYAPWLLAGALAKPQAMMESKKVCCASKIS